MFQKIKKRNVSNLKTRQNVRALMTKYIPLKLQVSQKYQTLGSAAIRVHLPVWC
jgi:hypothetical protein